MRMITRCPACGTGFRIYQEQLDARQGQVRCGHCAVVFNAYAHLATESDAPSPETAASATPQDNRSFVPDMETASTASEATPDVPTTPLHDEPPQAVAAGIEPHRAEAVIKQEPVALTMADATQFDFGRTAQTTNRTTNGWWTAATIVLIALLFLQGLYLFRTELARALPTVRPALERACALLACEVPYPREAEQISIESSDLQAIPGAKDVLVLSAVLRNRATFPQAYPAIELTLTDAADATVARRVLRPRDYLPEGHSTTVFVAASEAPLKLHIDAAGLGASGYRLYVFYP